MMVSVVVGSLAAWMFARRLSDRVAALAAGSKQIAAGNLETRIAQDGSDELANLATSFNQMAIALDGARKKITQQTNEIMAWNQTLEKRVEDKTAELRQAQDLLLRSRSLSALGELGAGVAHEINNPLTGALGHRPAAARRPAGGPPRPAAASGSGARGAADPQDRAEHAAARAAPERHRHGADRAGPRPGRRDRAVRPQRAVGRGHRGDPQVRAGAARARERDPAGGGVHPADPERAVGDAGPAGREADPRDQGDREQAGAR